MSSESRESEITEYGDRLAGLVHTMKGEADELSARRPHRDAHPYHIEEGLRHRANEIGDWLEENYYQ